MASSTKGVRYDTVVTYPIADSTTLTAGNFLELSSNKLIKSVTSLSTSLIGVAATTKTMGVLATVGQQEYMGVITEGQILVTGIVEGSGGTYTSAISVGDKVSLYYTGGVQYVAKSTAGVCGVVVDGTIASSGTTADTTATLLIQLDFEAEATVASVSDGAISTAKLANASVTGTKIATSGISSSVSLATGVVTTAKIADSAVTGTKIAAGGISSSVSFGAGVVATDVIADAAVTGTKIATSGISSSVSLATGVVATDKIANSAVTGTKIATGGISSSVSFASGVVTGTVIAAGGVGTDQIANAAVTGTKIATSGISSSVSIADGVVSSNKIVDGAITASKLEAASVTGTKIATGGISSSVSFADGVVAAAKLEAGLIINGTITDSASIAEGVIVATHFAVGSVGTAAIANAAVTGTKIATGGISSSVSFAGAIVTATKCATGVCGNQNPVKTFIDWGTFAQNATQQSTSVAWSQTLSSTAGVQVFCQALTVTGDIATPSTMTDTNFLVLGGTAQTGNWFAIIPVTSVGTSLQATL